MTHHLTIGAGPAQGQTPPNVPILRAKLSTVLADRASGRGDYDRLTAIADELREALADAEAAQLPPGTAAAGISEALGGPLAHEGPAEDRARHEGQG